MPLGDGPLQPGAVFAGHRIEGVAGRGGMGIVYRATHLALDHLVALKVISPQLASDERFRRRFEEESRIAVSIRHPNVVPIHHAGEEDGLLFVTMDLIEGSDLRGLMRARGTVAPEHAAAIVSEVAGALDAAHARGLVHRDIKPGNVLIEEGPGGAERVFLTDFGLARLVEATSGVTATGAFVGTLDYVAPEQIRGERVDARADVYALGCVLFELLTGTPPFASRDDKVAKMYAHLQEDPPRARVLSPELPRELDLVISRALAKDPGARYPSAGDLARATEAAVSGQPTVESERSVATGAAAPPPPTDGDREAAGSAPPDPDEPETEPETVAAPTPPRGPRGQPGARRRWMLGLAAAGVAIAAVVVALALTGGDDDPDGDGGPERATTTSGPERDRNRPARARVLGNTVRVDGLPVELAHGEGGIWVTSRRGGYVSLIEVEGDRQRRTRSIELPSGPEGVATGAGSIWVASSAGTLSRIDSGDDAVSREVPLGGRPQGVAFEDDGVWVTDAVGNQVVQVDPNQSDAGRRIAVGAQPYGITVVQGDLWVSNRADGTVSRVDPPTGEVVTIAVGANPKGIAELGGRIFVANTDDDTVSIIDPDSNRVAKTVEVGDQPRGVTAAFGSVWVVLGGEDAVARLDPNGEREERVGVGDGPEGITHGPKTVWVANGIDGTVTRIEP